MKQKINTILQDCLTAYPADLIGYLLSNEDWTKKSFRKLLEEASKEKEQEEHYKAALLEGKKEKAKLIRESWLYLPKKQNVSLQEALKTFNTLISSLKKMKYQISGHAEMKETLEKMGIVDHYNNLPEKSSRQDLVVFKESPRELNFKRSPTNKRFLETTSRRHMNTTEIVSVVNKLLEKELKSDKTYSLERIMGNCYAAFYFTEQIKLSFGDVIPVLNLRIHPVINTIRFYFSFARAEYKKFDLDDDIISVYADSSEKLLKSLFEEKICLEPKDTEYFENLFKRD